MELKTNLFYKKGQFYIFSTLFLLMLIFFIYSSGTDNTYIVKSTKFNMVENIQYETCQIGYLSNGSYIDSRFQNFETYVYDYCISIGLNCSLTITNNSVLPTNLSLLNYTYYDYNIVYVNNDYELNKNFSC